MAWVEREVAEDRELYHCAHLLRHPSHLVPFGRFVLRLPRVAEALAEAIAAALGEGTKPE